jgi:hypothetical protein
MNDNEAETKRLKKGYIYIHLFAPEDTLLST